jgi:transposase
MCRRTRLDVREVMNGIMYILSTGCRWRAIPKDLPPHSTLFDYLDLWSYDGTLDRIHHALYVECREQGQREASPTAAIIDSQSVKSAEKDTMGRRRDSAVKSSLRSTPIDGAPLCRGPTTIAKHASPRIAQSL